MKKFLFLGLLLVRLPAEAIEKGEARAAVLAELGEPSGAMQRDGKEILVFKTGTVTLQNGVVIKANLSQANVQQAEERAIKVKEFQAVKQAELEKQKLLYPEDHVIQIECMYNKTENWGTLPESIRPALGIYGYDVYIPPGYHESDSRRYKCLFLESSVLWGSVKERVHKEKWLVVILHEAPQQQVGKAMNGNFLAAFDDATGRFRIAKDQIFIVGRVPSAIFATLRPVAGIILQDPDFRGFEKAGISMDFLSKNPKLCSYVLLGDRDRDNMLFQGQFIIDHIPKSHVGIYEGSIAVMPQPLADEALDWMKKEYSIP
ncbi:MAG: hypothetical protein WCH86_07195 [Kiritimatiellales bacterium]